MAPESEVAEPQHAPSPTAAPCGNRVAEPRKSKVTFGEQETIPLLRSDELMLGDVWVRHAFVTRAYIIFGLQLFLSAGLGTIVMRAAEHSVWASPGIFSALLGGVGACFLALVGFLLCFPDALKRSPTNKLVVVLWTLCQGVAVGLISTQHPRKTILYQQFIASALVFALAIFACQTIWDFMSFRPYFFCVCAVTVAVTAGTAMYSVWDIHMAVLMGLHGVKLASATIGATLFTLYVIFDTQIIIGGKHENKFDLEDYLAAAITFYLDIFQIFIFLLQLFGERRR